jgi:hypothetical protein
MLDMKIIIRNKQYRGEFEMKKVISIIIVGIVILVVLFSIPSNAIDQSNVLDSKSEYAAIPPFEKPELPPKK